MPPHLRRLRTGLVATTVAAVGVAVALPAGASASSATPARVQVNTAATWTASAAATGAVPAATQLQLSAILSLRNLAGANALARAVSDPKSPSYGHYWTPAQWRRAFAPTSDQVNAVTSWLTKQGFTIGTIPANARYVSFSGTAAQVESAFGTSLSDFVKNGTAVIANTKAATVPGALNGIVAGITGLDTSTLAVTHHTTGDTPAPTVKAAAVAAPTTAAVPADELPPPDPVYVNAAPCSRYYNSRPAMGFVDPLKDRLFYVTCGYSPTQLRGAYQTDRDLAQGFDGRGTTIAVVDAYASPYIVQDLQHFTAVHDPSHPFRASQLVQNEPTTYSSTDDCDAGGWYGEETLDVEAVHTMAPGANILYVAGASCIDSDLSAAVNTVVDNNLAQIVTNSYGDAGESGLPDAEFIEGTQTSLQAAAEGITLMFSSGDDGDEIADIGDRETDYQASDPNVTAVGGTALAVGATNNWQRDIGWGTGVAPLIEGTNTFALPAVYQSGSGGGESMIFEQPWYQRGIVPKKISQYNTATPMRAVPDVALDADPQTGMLMGQSQSFPDGSIQYSELRIGGTSVASPLLAGLIATYDQELHRSLGFLNPVLYFLNGSPAFHDVNDGTAITAGVVRVNYNNSTDASEGTNTSLRTFNQTGTLYTRKGYDDVTGVGSPAGQNFINILRYVLGKSPGKGGGHKPSH